MACDRRPTAGSPTSSPVAPSSASSPPAADSAQPAATAWTCPFCALLCDTVEPAPAVPHGCPRARASLAALDDVDADALSTALIDGRPVDPATALHEAARRLAVWRQPLFGGLGTDIAGARALFRLAARTGAWCDASGGDAMMTAQRNLQDRGLMNCTLAEVRSRADLLVLVGTPATTCPAFAARIGLGDPASPCRDIVFLGSATVPPWATALPADAGAPAADGATAQAPHPAAPALHPLPGSGDLLGDLQQLAALLDERRLPRTDPGLADLAQRLRAARYAVLAWEPATLPADHGMLLVEMLNRLVVGLNRDTRAALFTLAGRPGPASVNQAFTWLSGLPLRTRVSAVDGLDHQPHLGATARLLAGEAVDGLLWISSFDPDDLPPPSPLPSVVLGPPAMAGRLAARPAPQGRVFVPVATPGVHAGGHLFRGDGPVVLPLQPRPGVPGAGLRSVAEALETIALGLRPPPMEATRA